MHHLGPRILTLLCCGGPPVVSEDVATWRKDENHLLLETEAAKLTDCPVRFDQASGGKSVVLGRESSRIEVKFKSEVQRDAVLWVRCYFDYECCEIGDANSFFWRTLFSDTFLSLYCDLRGRCFCIPPRGSRFSVRRFRLTRPRAGCTTSFPLIGRLSYKSISSLLRATCAQSLNLKE
ncbi:MAG: hypothetical protein QGF00_10100 [Planctomycetota bacterium]|nr:hypothetical protein [Planctomycetota bacterium]